jgi:hypothetical protein
MKRSAAVLILLLLFLAENIWAGGISIDFEILANDARARKFAEKFIAEIEMREEAIFKFSGSYWIRGYVGNANERQGGRAGAAIGIFVNDKELLKPADCIWLGDLFSEEAILIKAKESADKIFKYLLKLETKRKGQQI